MIMERDKLCHCLTRCDILSVLIIHNKTNQKYGRNVQRIWAKSKLHLKFYHGLVSLVHHNYIPDGALLDLLDLITFHLKDRFRK